MSKKWGTVFILAVLSVFFFYFSRKQLLFPQDAYCSDKVGIPLNSDTSFSNAYAGLTSAEKEFTGLLSKNSSPEGQTDTVMRFVAYSLGGTYFYTHENLDSYVGSVMVARGKRNKFSLEGTTRDEIWPVHIRCK